jgi:type II secretory pathway pseudopilin PulG
MTPPALKTEAQEGFIIIEVLVSALILAIVAGAVLTLVTATTRGAATQRTHAVAYGLAQEAQAELRTMRIGTLTNYSQPETKTIGGTEYTVLKQSTYVSNTTQTVSCGQNDKSDYIRLTTTVSAPTMQNPVTLRSVVSPTNGSLEPNVGTLMIQAKNAGNEPLPGVQFELKGKPTGNTYRSVSESTGCAAFGNVPAQSYTLLSSATGLVNKEGQSSGTQEITVATSEISRPPEAIYYDKPGWLEAEFAVLNAATGASEAAMVDSMQVLNTAAPTSTPATFQPTSGGRAFKLRADSLFPFSKSKYTVYAGRCEKDNPDPTGTKPANDAAMAFAEVPPGGAPSAPLRVQLPALNLSVGYGTKGPVSGVPVVLTDKCGTKRTYVTNSEGHLSSASSGPTEPGLPWSTYKVCLVTKVEGKFRRFEKESVPVETLTRAGSVLEVDLSKATESSKEC